jgi:hypothetical protein
MLDTPGRVKTALDSQVQKMLWLGVSAGHGHTTYGMHLIPPFGTMFSGQAPCFPHHTQGFWSAAPQVFAVSALRAASKGSAPALARARKARGASSALRVGRRHGAPARRSIAATAIGTDARGVTMGRRTAKGATGRVWASSRAGRAPGPAVPCDRLDCTDLGLRRGLARCRARGQPVERLGQSREGRVRVGARALPRSTGRARAGHAMRAFRQGQRCPRLRGFGQRLRPEPYRGAHSCSGQRSGSHRGRASARSISAETVAEPASRQGSDR